MWYNIAMKNKTKAIISPYVKKGMKNSDLFKLRNALQIVSRHSGVKFAYSVARNLNKIESEINLLLSTIKPSKKYLEYDKKRVELCQKYANQKDGKREFVNDNYVIKDKKNFEKDHENLKKECRIAIDEQVKKLEEYNDVLLEEKSDFEPYFINKEDLPQEIT